MNSELTFPLPLTKWFEDFQTKLRFRFYLPNIKRATPGGVKLNLSGMSSMMKNIILNDRYESQERKYCAKALGPEDTVLELGSAIGFIGLFCRKTLGVRHVTGVEANPNTLSLLKENYRLNGLQPDVIHAAAAAEDGELELDIDGEFWENTIATAKDAKSKVKVPALSFESLIEKMPHSPTALVCDIEGAEAYLNFSRLPDSVTTIVIELHPAITGNDGVSTILTSLSDLGFQTIESEEDCYLLSRK